MTPAPNPRLVLQVRNLSKSFPGVAALAEVSLDVRRGSVHALMGENGAGKSTLMKILAGLEQPDDGVIWFKGNSVRIRNPHEALRLGIAMIHQELLPFPELTIAENIFMGAEPTLFPGWIDRVKLNADAARLLNRLGVNLPPIAKMRRLSIAQMQAVEVAKALAHRAEVIIMDEPTSALSEREVEGLFGVIRELQQQGVAVIFISHKMDEIFRIADTITVLRDGRFVASHPAAELDSARLIQFMVGREVNAGSARAATATGEVALAVRGLTKAGKFRDIHFEVRRGEVLGIAGLMGAGRTEVVSAIYGLAPADSGEICVHGQRVGIKCPADAMAHGIGLVSEDRKKHGLVLKMSVKHNLTLASLRRCCRGGWIQRRCENDTADEKVRAFGIKTAGRDQRVNLLSGGNQQKVVLAKVLLNDPGILILDEPTRGIDIGAKAEVYALISRLAREGRAIIMVSSELPEVLAMSDRLIVMREGELAAELDPRRTTQEEVLHHAMPR